MRQGGLPVRGREPHGPYASSPRARWPRPGPVRSRCPADVVRRYLQRGEQVEAVLAEISAINAELLARRELR